MSAIADVLAKHGGGGGAQLSRAEKDAERDLTDLLFGGVASEALSAADLERSDADDVARDSGGGGGGGGDGGGYDVAGGAEAARSGAAAARKSQKKAALKPAWIDEDDEAIRSINIEKNRRLKADPLEKK